MNNNTNKKRIEYLLLFILHIVNVLMQNNNAIPSKLRQFSVENYNIRSVSTVIW